MAKSKYAVIPQENTIGGAVTDYVDILISQTDVSVVGEVELPINQNLLTLPDTDISGIRTVYSHKQGIAQGKEWLETNLPDAEIIEVSSTAKAARTAFVASGSANDLPELMSEIQVRGIDLITIHDRPLKTELGEYSYLFECEHCTHEDFIALSENSSLDMRFLGCFNVR